MAASETGRRLPPQNIEAEQSVLGAVLLDNEVSHDVAELLLADDFYRETHRRILIPLLFSLNVVNPRILLR